MTKVTLKSKLSESAQKILKKHQIKISRKNQGRGLTVKYAKSKQLEMLDGYDLLENMMVARPYIQRRYDIDLGLLEVLLYLAPKSYFTQKDYAEMPKQFKYRSLNNLLDTGFFTVLQLGENMEQHLYTVNPQGNIIVRHFYEILSGEKKISEHADSNPLARKTNRAPFDRKKMQLIHKLNLLGPPEKKKGYYS